MAMTMQSFTAKGSFVGKCAELKSSPASAAKAVRVPVVVKAQQQDAVSGAATQTQQKYQM